MEDDMGPEEAIKGAAVAVFDLDGTLFRLNVDWEKVYERLSWISREYGHVGIFRSLVEAYLWSEKVYRAKERLVEAQAEMEEECLLDISMVPGGVKAARWRLSRSLPTAVLSLNSRNTLEKVLGHWGFYPIIGIENIESPKPDPQGLELILKAHGKGPGEAVFIGNSDIDRRCAGSAGVIFVHVDDIREEWFE
ncbi:MAG: HAD family hydrolase [Candidatus Thermoplasmatota archaeon]|nr:HAD family hydrolase [Candidatus Thermoplasmatota archaeon]